MNNPNTTVSPRDKFMFKKQIRKGSYGEIWLAEWNGLKVAAKQMHQELFKRKYGQEIIDHYIGEFRKEWEILRKLDHANIVKMHTVLFPVNESPIIVMELMHCDLLRYIENSTSTPKVSTSKVLSIAVGVAEGLQYLHGLTPPVVHRDICPKNILLTANGHPKIADFHVAKVLPAGRDDLDTEVPGSSFYAAPETTHLDAADHSATYGVEIDIFSFGVTLLVMLVGHEPILDPPNLVLEDRSRVQKMRENYVKQIQGHALEQTILNCLKDQSSSRSHAHEIVKKLKEIERVRRATLLRGQLLKCDPSNEFERVSSQSHYDYNFNVVFLGSSSVGKTSLLQLLKNPAFDFTSTIPSVAMSFVFQSYKYNSRFLKLKITDTAGQEIFLSIPPIYLRHASGIFLVYDISDKETFEMLPYWMEMIEQLAPENCKVLLVGNKTDLRELPSQKPLVPHEAAIYFANKLALPYMETSAKDIDSIWDMLQKMVEMLMSTVSVRVEDIQVQEEEKPSTSESSFPPKRKKEKGFLQCSWF